MARSFISRRRSVICSAPARAVATTASATFRLFWMVLNADWSVSMTLAMAQTAALSLALPTALPVEISACALPRLAFTDFRVWSATMALLLVRMLDMLSSD